MSISINCPACGAQISIDESGGQVTCPYCGNHFEVNLDNTQPEFKMAGSSPEPAAENSAEAEAELNPDESTREPAALSTQVDYGYSQSTDQSGPQIYTTITQSSNFPWRRFGVIGILVLTGAFCLACLCMVVIIQRVVR